MVRKTLTPEMLALVAERLRALAEPARLQILNELRSGEHTVTELVEATGLGQANVSKHLRLLLAAGFVGRRKDGLSPGTESRTRTSSGSARSCAVGWRWRRGAAGTSRR